MKKANDDPIKEAEIVKAKIEKAHRYFYNNPSIQGLMVGQLRGLIKLSEIESVYQAADIVSVARNAYDLGYIEGYERAQREAAANKRKAAKE